MKKVTLQDIANLCGVSRVTVWKALNNHDGVSAPLHKKIIETALNMGYPLDQKDLKYYKKSLIPETNAGRFPGEHNPAYQVALAVSRPETSIFWGRIITSISEYLKDFNVTLRFVCLPVTYDEDYILPSNFMDGSLHGLIVMNIYDSHLFGMLNSLPIPKVFLDCTPGTDFRSITGDLYLIEGRSSVKDIITHAVSQGCSSIGFIGDIMYAQTNYERYLGYCSALQEVGIELDERYCLTRMADLDNNQADISLFLNSLADMPDMFVCASDYLAQLAMQQLTMMGYTISKDIMISGFDDSMEFSQTKHLTSVHVQNHNIGVRLANQILYHMNHPDADYEITYIRSTVIFRESTGTLPALRNCM